MKSTILRLMGVISVFVAPGERNIMNRKLMLNGLLFLAPCLAPNALASTTWYVDGVDGSDTNNCLAADTACKTIGHAISRAVSGDSIMVAAATYTENLTIPYRMSLNVIGANAITTIIDGQRAGSSVITISIYAQVTLSNLTIRNGMAEFGGGINNNNYGRLTMNNITVTGNVAFLVYRGASYSYGGGIYNGEYAVLTINDSTVSGNTAGSFTCGLRICAGYGGGIFNSTYGELLINNSTIIGNSAYGSFRSPAYSKGGGIYNYDGNGIVGISNSTITGNSAVQDGGIRGATVQNSIIAHNTGGNCSVVISRGYNLSSDTTCNFSPAEFNNIDPKLGMLGYYGGQTQTIPLLSGSPAIDAGNPNGCTDAQGNLLKTDQRGMPRPDPGDTGRCDMGAYEAQGQ